MADEQVKVTLTLDSKQYEQMMKSASKHTDAVDDSIKKTGKSAGKAKADWSSMGAAITVAGGLAVVALKKAVDAASDLNESTTKMQTIFGAASGDIEKFASTAATSLGMSKTAAMEAASMMATFGKAAGLTGKELSTFSTDMVTLSGDLASFFNSSPDEAMDAIGAALRGESEPIRKYGVLLDDATLKNRALEMGLISSTKNALTPQQKALAAQKEILAQTTDAQGDFARTSDGLANSQRVMAAAMTDAQAALGQALLPIMAKGVNVVAKLAEAFAGLPAPIRDTAAGLGLVAAVLATVGPTAIKAAKALKDMINTAKASKAGAGLAKSLGALGPAAAAAAGPLGIAAAAVTGMVVAGKMLTALALEKRMAAIATAMKDAQVAGGHLDSVLSVTFNDTAPQVKAVTNEVVTLQGALSDMGNGATDYGITPEGVQRTVTGLKGIIELSKGTGFAAKEASAQLKLIDTRLAEMNPGQAATEWQYLKGAMEAAGGSTTDLVAAMPQYITLEKDAAIAAGTQSAEEQSKADAIKASNDAQQKAIDLVTGYINAQMAAAGAADALLGAQDRLTKAHKTNGDALKGTTAAAVNNREALRSEIGMVLANANAKIDQAKASGKTTVEAYEIGNAAIKKGKKSLEDAAVAAGYNKGEVKKLLDQYMKLPKDVKTQIQATGVGSALNTVAGFAAALKALPEEVRVAIYATASAARASAAAKHAAGIPGSAAGGKITGPGTGTSDSIPAMLSNGEWVVPADSAAKYGDAFMASMVAGDVAGFAAGGKAGSKKKPPTEAQKKAAAKRKANAKAAAKRKAAQKAADARQAVLDDIDWQYDMDKISLATKIAKEQAQLKKLKAGSQEAKDLQLTIHRDQKDYQAQKAADAEKQQSAADEKSQARDDAMQKVIDSQQAIAQGVTGGLTLGQAQANGKKWTASSMLGDFANRAQQAKDFTSMITQLSKRGLSEEVINQVLAAGPVAGADMAKALIQMSSDQIKQVNASQAAIGTSGQQLGTALTPGMGAAGARPAASEMTVNMTGGAPVVLQLDSRAIYEGQLTLKRQMGGSYALAGS